MILKFMITQKNSYYDMDELINHYNEELHISKDVKISFNDSVEPNIFKHSGSITLEDIHNHDNFYVCDVLSSESNIKSININDHAKTFYFQDSVFPKTISNQDISDYILLFIKKIHEKNDNLLSFYKQNNFLKELTCYEIEENQEIIIDTSIVDVNKFKKELSIFIGFKINEVFNLEGIPFKEYVTRGKISIEFELENEKIEILNRDENIIRYKNFILCYDIKDTKNLYILEK